MSVISEIARNIVVMFMTILISVCLLVGFIILMVWLIYSKVNIGGIPISTLIGK